MPSPHGAGRNVPGQFGTAFAALAVLALCQLAVRLDPDLQFPMARPVYLFFHSLVEIASVAVTAGIFAIAWHSQQRERTLRDALVASAFLSVAILDAVHALSIPGMPDFVTPSGVAKGINFFLAARLMAAVAVMRIALGTGRTTFGAASSHAVLGAFVAATLGFCWLGIFHPGVMPRTFDPAQGLTPFKIGAEYALVVTYFLASLILVVRGRREPGLAGALLAFASGAMGLSELWFTLYTQVNDAFNVLGHVYKLVAYVALYRALLVRGIKAPYRLLAASEAELARQAAEIREANAQLEARVIERTRDLASAVRDLEQFSSAVSHDLRAPLRHIATCASRVAEKAGDAAAAAAQAERIQRSVRRMNDLVDALLAAARHARAPLSATEVDMNVLVGEVVADARADEAGARVDWRVAPLPGAWADAVLLRAVLDNIVGNAVKYSAREAAPRVEIGHDGTRAEPAYFVRDNGVGFDMAYAGKLFGMFQRMHGESDFPGTGVGLAAAKRILERHGGRVWAESAPGAGATFFFTLPARGTTELGAPG